MSEDEKSICSQCGSEKELVRAFSLKTKQPEIVCKKCLKDAGFAT